MKNFWQVKSMEDFTEQEWDDVCLRCGKCCAEKTSDQNNVYFYNRLCDNFDLVSGLCKNYDNRLCSECLKVDLNVLCNNSYLLPETCAYRMLKEKGKLPDYHPLITGDAESVKKARQTALDWKGAHSLEGVQLLAASIINKANKESWSADQFEDALKEALSPYVPVVVEVYKKNGS